MLNMVMQGGRVWRRRLPLALLALVLSSLHAGIQFTASPAACGERALAGSRAELPEPLRGMAYGPFREGESPELGIYPSLAEVQEDMPLLKLVANGIRTYGCQNLETVITASRESNLPLALGAWLSGDPAADSAEVDCVVEAALANPHITSIIVGNESILKGWLTTAEVCSYIEDVQTATGLQVTTAEPYHIWTDHADLAECADYLLIHIHPYWDCQLVEDAVAFVQEKYELVRTEYPDQTVVIGETGWPTAGSGRENDCQAASPLPSPEQQVLFAAEFLSWVEQEGVDFYFFEAFDEPWKCDNGPEVECHWGIYDAERVPKPARDLFVPHLQWLPVVLKGH